MNKEKLEAILVEYGVPFTDALSDRLIKEFDTPSGEYIKKEDVLRAVYGMARPTGIDETPYEYAEDAIYDLPTYSIPEREKGEWIPVSERLPEKNVWVLVTVEQIGLCYQEIMRRNNCKEGWTDNIDFYTDEITAWQPLPEPYKEGGKK